jgi:hypothetical protein
MPRPPKLPKLAGAFFAKLSYVLAGFGLATDEDIV